MNQNKRASPAYKLAFRKIILTAVCATIVTRVNSKFQHCIFFLFAHLHKKTIGKGKKITSRKVSTFRKTLRRTDDVSTITTTRHHRLIEIVLHLAKILYGELLPSFSRADEDPQQVSVSFFDEIGIRILFNSKGSIYKLTSTQPNYHFVFECKCYCWKLHHCDSCARTIRTAHR